MRKLLSALTLTLLLTVNTVADTISPAATEPPPADITALVVIFLVAIAIPNLLKSGA
jgi:hypothetical protein